jgi:hypothetical protein
MSASVPQDIRYTNLKPAEVAFLQQTVPVDAVRKGLTATIDTAQEPGDRTTVTIHFSPTVPTTNKAAASAPVALAPPQALVPPAVGINFTAGGAPLTQSDIDQAVAHLDNIEPQLIWAIIRKESETLAGFLDDRRPVILYERHIFAKRSNNSFTTSHPEISGPPYKTYGTLADQYARLNQAIILNRSAALEACSWGLGQVLGENATALGYANVESMVTEMIQSEAKQLQAVVAFLRHNNLVEPLRNKRWDEFSSIYNGGANPTYATLLQQGYNVYVTQGLPDLNVRSAQLCLSYLGYSLSVDGRFGDHTKAAVIKFQQLAGIEPPTGTLDQATWTTISRFAFG